MRSQRGVDGREEEGTGLGRNLGESRGASPTAGRFQMRPDPPRAPPRLEAASPPLASGRGDCFRQRSREKPRRVTSEWAGEGPALIPREPSWLPATRGVGSPSTWRGHGWRLWPAVLARPRCSHPGPDAQLGRASSGPGYMSQSKPTEPLFPGGAPDAADQGQPWAGPLRPTESLPAPAAERGWLLLQRRDRDVSLGRRARGRAASESWRRRRDWRGAGVSGAGRRRGPDSQVWASGQRCCLSLRQSD